MTSLDISLKQFEGPVGLLLALIQKEELDLLAISLKEITTQLGTKTASIDLCADSMALTATLLLWKSERLLPHPFTPSEEREDERLTLLQQLITYCHMKEAAHELTKQEETQRSFFRREPSSLPYLRPTGLTEVSLQTLSDHFQTLLARRIEETQTIHDEVWHVTTQMRWLQEELARQGFLSFDALFSEEKNWLERIVTFLALLELIKHAHVSVRQEENMIIGMREAPFTSIS